MPRYIIRTQQIHNQWFEVEADSEEEAIQKTANHTDNWGCHGREVATIGDAYFIRYSDPANWSIEEINNY